MIFAELIILELNSWSTTEKAVFIIKLRFFNNFAEY